MDPNDILLTQEEQIQILDALLDDESDDDINIEILESTY